MNNIEVSSTTSSLLLIFVNVSISDKNTGCNNYKTIFNLIESFIKLQFKTHKMSTMTDQAKNESNIKGDDIWGLIVPMKFQDCNWLAK